METQVAPLAQLSSALSNGQSDTASEPSFIPSVSRLGLATEPESRWSRPMTMGALNSPLATISLNARPSFARSPSPTQQMRVVWDQFFYLGVGFINIFRVAGEGHPTKRADASAEERPDIRRDKAWI